MRILLTANASYVPPRGGATRSNLVWLKLLAAAGHSCRVVASSLAHDPAGRVAQMEEEEIRVSPVAEDAGEGVEVLERGPIRVYSAADTSQRRRVLRQQIREFEPDWVLVSSEDLGQMLLREAHSAAPGRVVYLAHTPQLFPFGPASWNPDRQGTGLVLESAAIIAIGEHTARYFEEHAGRPPAVVHPPIYGDGPFERYGAFDRGLITIINPCAVKGLPIFLALARRFPEFTFGALPGWGTTLADRRALERLSNVRVLPNVKHIEQILRETRVLLMPSLWYEGFGLSVMEAMLRGVPVVASDSGGLLEAKMGTRFILPVRPIERYEPVFDEHGLPNPVVPEQDIGPWGEALHALLSDRAVYEEESEVSRRKASEFVGRIRSGRMEEFLRSLKPATGAPERRPSSTAMRILLAHNSLYYPSHGGGDKSNRLLMEALAARGHECCVVARLGSFGAAEQERFLGELAIRGIRPRGSDGGVVVFEQGGVEVHVLAANPNLRACFSSRISSFHPSVIIASTDDPAQLLLEPALRAEKTRVVCLVRATLATPFGPDCAFPSAAKTEVLRQVDGVVGVSQYAADYVRRWSGIEAVHVPISLMDPGPYPKLGRLGNEFVTLVNPCAVKGISIFLALADRMPEVRFAAVPTWGTNEGDREELKKRPNIRVLDSVDSIDDLLARTRVLLAPSLWAEARSRIIVEAMLRGVPVAASDIGGIPEAKMGVPYLLPVRPIAKYRPSLDEQMVPIAEVPAQDIGPWHEALDRLLSDPGHYEDVSAASRKAALSYVENLSIGPFEHYLDQIVQAPERKRTLDIQTPSHSALDRLSPEKRRLLALRLRKQETGACFPGAGKKPGTRLRLFCFPYAGGGTSSFHGWADVIPSSVLVCPARLPGRESRLAEAPFRRMPALVDALYEAILPYTGEPFAFFGNSMGAAVAFELTRSLRRKGRLLPIALFVAGSRAPQFRRGHVPQPEPSEADFIEELRRLEGIPREVLDHPELMRVILPALSADTALYRNYVYEEDEPLSCAIRVYGGTDDPNVNAGRLEAWKEQTTSFFALRMFPGGHFFVDTARSVFLSALAADLEEVIRPVAT